MKRLIRTARLWAENQNQNYLDSKQKYQPFNRNVRLYRTVKPGALGNRYRRCKRKTQDKSRVVVVVVVTVVAVVTIIIPVTVAIVVTEVVVIVAVVVPWNSSP
jgi:hypothetical protein